MCDSRLCPKRCRIRLDKDKALLQCQKIIQKSKRKTKDENMSKEQEPNVEELPECKVGTI